MMSQPPPQYSQGGPGSNELPLLLMRTVMLAVTTFPELKNFVATVVLPRLVQQKVWKHVSAVGWVLLACRLAVLLLAGSCAQCVSCESCVSLQARHISRPIREASWWANANRYRVSDSAWHFCLR